MNNENNNPLDNNNTIQNNDINNTPEGIESIIINNTPVETLDEPTPEVPVANEPVNPADLVEPVLPVVEQPSTEPPVSNEPLQPNQVQQPNQVPITEPLPVNNPLPSIESLQQLQQSQQPEQPIKTSSNKTPIFIIVGVVIVALLVGGYFLFNKPTSSNGGGESNGGASSSLGKNCTKISEIEGNGSFDDISYIETGDTQYFFDGIVDGEILAIAFDFVEVEATICYKELDNSKVEFHAGETTKTRQVESIEFYDTSNNKKISANNKKEFLKELGYHSAGKYTEKAKVVDKEDYPGSGYADGKSYTFYNIYIELSSGKKVSTLYNVYEGQENKFSKIQKGETYTFDFEVKEDLFDVMEYTITDIK